ncbi:MAG: TlpA disulfide reductase family protein [Nocardioidaceae bacterium]
MRRLVGAAVACLLLAACSASPSTSTDGGVSEGRVDVNTAALRSLKARAGVQPCVPGTSTGRLPRVTLPCLGGGRPVDLAALRGPLVINLFAQWCGPCREELPYYQQLHEKAKGTLGVLGIDYLDTQPAQALRLAQSSGVTYPLLADPAGALRTAFKIRGLPGLVLVDKDGRVTDVEFRVVRSYAELRGLVQKHLGVRLPA